MFCRCFFLLSFLLVLAGSGSAAAPFAEAGVAFLESHCVKCHGKDKQKGDLTLHEVRDEATLLRARKRWQEVLSMVESGDMPPEEERQPTAEERKQFLASVTQVFAAANSGRADPGRLTLRRLNRTEYNNTIRDLLKVDFRPAENFPSDEVGHGFDNIADVLSVSPVLMERYLDAAESIAALAIPNSTAAAPKRTMSGKFLEPASPDVPQDRFRPITASRRELIHSGPLHTPARISTDGEYMVRAKLYAKSANGKPVSVALLVTGDKLAKPSSAFEIAKLDGAALPAITPAAILKVAEITATDEQHAQLIEVKIPPMEGAERVAIAALKPPVGQAAPTLFVEWLECEGPLDAPSPATKALMVFTPGRSQADQARELLWRFASKAWRRPVSQSELDRLCSVVSYAAGHGETWEEGLRRAVAAVLASPKFVFRLEPDELPNSAEPHPLNEFQLATRLSYFLWSSCPDDELLQLATERRLNANLDGQIARMLKDPKALALVENFALQWLQVGRLAGHTADPKTFPKWRPELRAAMVEETRRFCAEIMQQDRSILDFLDADFTWLNRRLGDVYGITPPGGFRGDEWKRVSLAGTQRGGLLTHASVLTVTSNPTRTSPVKRGKWVLEQILGNPPPPPPADIPSLDDSQRKELTGTFRQKLEQHREDPKCANCHTKMDAFGFALDQFDAIGQWRERDETGALVNASSKLPGGRELRGLADLKILLRDRQKEFARCFTEKLLTYALGRGLDYYDEPALDRIQAALAADRFRFSSLVRQIVRSDPFRLRRGKGQAEPQVAQK
ncbi:MAG TPA: DUF1592 domain-containing protein [Chthoniobacteraceae bacterium]